MASAAASRLRRTISCTPWAAVWRSRNAIISRNLNPVSMCSSGNGIGPGANARRASSRSTDESLPIEYRRTGRANSATVSRRAKIASASSSPSRVIVRLRPVARRVSGASPRRDRRRLRALQVLVVPIQVALEPIDLVTGNRDAVELRRIDDELRVDAETLQRLIHLLAADRGHVEVLFAHHEQRRRLDPVGVEERIGDLDPQILRFPRRADLGLVLRD